MTLILTGQGEGSRMDVDIKVLAGAGQPLDAARCRVKAENAEPLRTDLLAARGR